MRALGVVLMGAMVTMATPVSGQVVGSALDFGWLSDGRRFTVGDIVTVVVDEYTSASADRATSALEDRRTDAGLGVNANGTTVDGSLGSFLGNESTQRGRDYRQDRFNAEVSVRVTEVEPGGALRVEGTKTVMIDEHEQEVTVRGIVRPQDISSRNTVDSWRIAEVEVLYASDGSLVTADKGILSRLLAFIIP